MTDNAHIEIRRVYLKDASFETPKQNTENFFEKWKPHLDVTLNTSHAQLEEQGVYEVTLRVTITAKQEQAVAFLVEVHQAGIFKLTRIKDSQLSAAIQVHCANVLFPFAREALSSLVTKGGFPQLLLGPMDFQSLYQQKIKALEEQKSVSVTH